ncbi:lanthionine synthetase C family protein [Streptomyces sp. NPDC059009]|uniref:lanthionine synthetase C family protein n=1 Tax=Streptomyces sp. NPDC059009 TaxID=3346694 RepID=UPI0036D1FAAF
MSDDEARGLARDMAGRLVESAGTGTASPDLGEGAPGIALALLHAAEVFDDDGYMRAGRLQLRRTAEATATTPLTSAGLYSGTAGIVWVVAEYARREPRYLRTLTAMTDQLARQSLALTHPLSAGSVAPYDYDVLEGAAGRLAALLKAAEVLGRPATGATREAIDDLVDYLLALTRADGNGDGMPTWVCAPASYPTALGTGAGTATGRWYAETFPEGHFNLGFAHGPPGILAALCRVDLAHTHGVVGRGGRGDTRARLVRQRIDALVRRMDAWRLDGHDHPAWAALVPPDPATGLPDTGAAQEPARAAWCYGAPGIAASLLSAATASAACGAPGGAVDLATAALLGVRRAPAEQQRLFSPTVCHGLAGLLAICGRAAAHTREPDLRQMCAELRSRLCAYADPDHPYLFADRPVPERPEHRPGLLTGAAGALLALLGSVSPEAAEWDEVLFLTRSDSESQSRV